MKIKRRLIEWLGRRACAKGKHDLWATGGFPFHDAECSRCGRKFSWCIDYGKHGGFRPDPDPEGSDEV